MVGTAASPRLVSAVISWDLMPVCPRAASATGILVPDVTIVWPLRANWPKGPQDVAPTFGGVTGRLRDMPFHRETTEHRPGR